MKEELLRGYPLRFIEENLEEDTSDGESSEEKSSA